jgi:hypothetical protein
VPGFFFFAGMPLKNCGHEIPAPVFLLVRYEGGFRLLAMAHRKKNVASPCSGVLLKLQPLRRAMPSRASQGYPLPMSKKKRACVVTYRHSGEELFEKSSLPYSNVNNL